MGKGIGANIRIGPHHPPSSVSLCCYVSNWVPLVLTVFCVCGMFWLYSLVLCQETLQLFCFYGRATMSWCYDRNTLHTFADLISVYSTIMVYKCYQAIFSFLKLTTLLLHSLANEYATIMSYIIHLSV